jgi:glycerol-3-phosphate acyltransferase PlsY
MWSGPEGVHLKSKRALYLSLILAGAYFPGSLKLAYYAGKYLGGVDLREAGSGNLVAGNVFKQVGKAAGAAVFFLDCAKEALAILVPRALGSGLVKKRIREDRWRLLINRLIGDRETGI